MQNNISEKEILEEISALINSEQNFLVFAHDNMDGDAFGSSYALCAALRSLGKNAYIVFNTIIPPYLNPLNHHEEYYVHENPYEDNNYVAISVDCADLKRFAKCNESFIAAKKRVVIDHHVEEEYFGDINLVDASYAACAMLIFKLLKELKVKIDKDMAEHIYCGISTDTGSFQYCETNAEVLRMTADLYDYGIDTKYVCNVLYSSIPISQLKLQSMAIDRMDLFADGKAVISYLMQNEMLSVGGTYEQADTCIDRLREIEGVEISCMIRENIDGVLRVSVRSKNYACARNVCLEFNGGGHYMASGCRFSCGVDEAVAKLKDAIVRELNRAESEK